MQEGFRGSVAAHARGSKRATHPPLRAAWRRRVAYLEPVWRGHALGHHLVQPARLQVNKLQATARQDQHVRAMHQTIAR